MGAAILKALSSDQIQKPLIYNFRLIFPFFKGNILVFNTENYNLSFTSNSASTCFFFSEVVMSFTDSLVLDSDDSKN